MKRKKKLLIKYIKENYKTESPELIETIISNPEVRKIAEEFWKDIGRLLNSAQEGNGHEIVTYINANKDKLAENVDLGKSYKKLTKMVSAMKN